MITTADPTTWGWQTAGFATPSLPNVIDYLVGRIEYHLGVTVPRNETSPVYLMATAIAEAAVNDWEGWRATIDALDRPNAWGAALEVVGRSVGVDKLGATASTVLLEISGTAGATAYAGDQFSNAAGTAVFALDADAVVGGGGTVEASATCVVTGPVTAAAITEIVNPRAGITDVAIADGEEVSPGRDIETDAAYRRRIDVAIWSGGRGTPGAIRAALLATPGVVEVKVYQNRTGTTDGDGRPGHSWEAVIWAGLDEEGSPATVDDTVIAPVIAGQLIAGIRTHGTTTATTTGTDGESVTVSWTAATGVDIDVTIVDVELDDTAPDSWADDIVNAVTEWLNARSAGDTIRAFRLNAVVGSVAGVIDATVTFRRGSNPFATTDITTTSREVPYAGTIPTPTEAS